jgi:hypothetical protein
MMNMERGTGQNPCVPAVHKEEKNESTQKDPTGFFVGERALFQGANLQIYDTIFADGESPLKESRISNSTAACSN